MAYWKELFEQVQTMANFLHLLKKPSAIGVMVLCVVLAAGLFFWDRYRVWDRVQNPDSLWTVTMDDEEASYTFRGPLDMFLIHRSLVTSHRKLTAHTTSLTMEWHYESGQPWKQWTRQNHKKTQIEDRIQLSASVDIVSPDTDTAARAKSVYLDRAINNPNPAAVAKPMGRVWNDTVLKFEGYATYYLIEEREPYDGRVITCNTGAWYCRLEGARVNDTLELNSVMVWKEDVMNWKQYQDKARSLIQQVIVDKDSTN